MVGEPIEERGGHLGVAEDAGPFAEGEVRGDHDGGLLVEAADEVEQQLPAGLGEGQVAEFVEHHEVETAEQVGRAPLSASAGLGAAFLVMCDVGARTLLSPMELPVGIITAMLGGPFFLWLLVRSR